MIDQIISAGKTMIVTDGGHDHYVKSVYIVEREINVLGVLSDYLADHPDQKRAPTYVKGEHYGYEKIDHFDKDMFIAELIANGFIRELTFDEMDLDGIEYYVSDQLDEESIARHEREEREYEQRTKNG